MKKIKYAIYFIRCLLADLTYVLSSEKTRKLIEQDARAISKRSNIIFVLNEALMAAPFRNIFYYRLKKEKFPSGILSYINRIILPMCNSVEITGGEFEGGFQIVHNNCVIHANRVGKNLKVGPGAIIGKNRGGVAYNR